MAEGRQPMAVEMRDGPPFGSVLEVGDWNAVKVRVVISPMHTLVVGLMEIVGGRDRGAPTPWIQTVLARARDLDLAPFDFYFEGAIRIPDFFMVPASFPSFAQQLEALAATPPELIREDLHYEYGEDVPGPLARWARDPAAALARYCRALEGWWNAVLKPSWPPLQSALESEVLRIGRLLVTLSPAEALPKVHPRLVVSKDALFVDGGPNFERHVLGDRPVLLVPIAAGREAILTAFDHREGAVFGHAAPGTQDLLAREARAPAPDLAALLGEPRARLIAHLEQPTSTTELAGMLRYAPSTVSSHLQALAAMGLVQSARHGKFVFYQRTERAHALVELYA